MFKDKFCTSFLIVCIAFIVYSAISLPKSDVIRHDVEEMKHRIIELEQKIDKATELNNLSELRDLAKEIKREVQLLDKKESVILIKLDKILERK